MVRYVVFAFFFAAASIQAGTAKAGIFFCNDTGIKLSIAVGFIAEDKSWESRGWYNVKPRDCIAPIKGALTNRYYYFYAEGKGLTWSGGEGSSWFCAHKTDKFYYSQRDGCFGYRFKRIDVGEGVDQYTYTMTEGREDPLAAARACAGTVANGRNEFAKCWMREVATAKQRQILDCVDGTKSNSALAICATKGYLNGDAKLMANCAQEYAETKNPRSMMLCATNGRLGEENERVLRCALENMKSSRAAAICAASGRLSADQRQMVGCITENYQDYKRAGSCLIASRMSKEQAKIAECVMNNRGSYIQMGVCAAGDSLTPEQQAFLECAIQTGGQPYAYAGCVGSRLTLNEIDKCFTQGIGGSGCFGENNTIVKHYANMWKDVTKGPGPSNDLVGEDGALIRTMRNAWSDITEGPGENNEICKLGLCW